MDKMDLNDALMSPSELLEWFLDYHESLDEAGKQRLWERMDMDNYDPAEMEPAAFEKRLEQQTLEMQRDLDPDGPNMKSLFKSIDEAFEWDLMTPWWKKALVKAGLVKL